MIVKWFSLLILNKNGKGNNFYFILIKNRGAGRGGGGGGGGGVVQPLQPPLYLQLKRKHKDAKTFEKHLNPVILVFIGQLSLSTLS